MLIGEAIVQITANAEPVLKAFKTVGDSVKQLASSADSSSKGVTTAMDKMKAAAQKSGESFGKAKDAMVDFSKGILAVGTTIAGFAVKSAIDFEQTRVSIETMVGSAGKAQTMMQELSDFAKSTPFTLPQITEASSKLLAYGVAAKDVIPTMQYLGDIASGVGRDKLPNIIMAFGQMNAATKLYGTELRQFTEAGIPLLEELSRVTGKSAQEIKEAMDKGMTVPAGLVKQALQNMTEEGGRFNGLMEKQSKTLGGIVSNISDAIGNTVRSLVGISTDGTVKLGSAFDFLRRGAQTLQEWLQKLSEASPDLQKKILSVSGAVIGSVAAFLGLIAAMKAIMLLSNPFMLVFAAIAAVLGTKIYNSLQTAQKGFTETKKVANESLDSINDKTGTVATAVTKMSDETIKALANIDKQIKNTEKDYLESLSNIIQSHQDNLKSLQDNLAKEISSYAEASAKELKDQKEKLAEMSDNHNEKTNSILKDIEKEKVAYQKTNAAKYKDMQEAMDKENASYKKAVNKETGDITELVYAHQQKTDEIMANYQEQMISAKESTDETLRDLQEKLTQENLEYTKAKDEQIAKNKEATEEAKKEHDGKLLALQTELDTEKAFLEKHLTDVQAVKDVARLDEIEKLKADTAEKMAQYAEDKNNAISEGASKETALIAQNATISTDFATTSNNMAASMAGAAEKINLSVGGIGTTFTGLGDKFAGIKDSIILGAEAIAAIFVTVKATMLIQTGLMITQGLSPLAAFIKATPWGIVITTAIVGLASVMNEINGLKNALDGLEESRERGRKLDNEILAEANAARSAGNNAKADRLMQIYGTPQPESTKLNWFQQLLLGVDHFASGVQNFAGGMAVVGEEGPELVQLPKGSNVIPNNKLGDTLKTRSQNITINFSGDINNQSGYTPEEIGSIINRQLTLVKNGA